MASKQESTDKAVEVLKDILTVQLLLGGVPQRSVREIVKCDMNRVTAIARVLRRRDGGKQE